MRKTMSKKAKAEFEQKVAETFNRKPEGKKAEDRISNHDLKVMESGLTTKKYEAFTKKHGFEYLQTFASWKKNGYSIKAGSKGKKLELYSKTASGNWSLKTYYYFTFEQVEVRENPIKKTIKTLADYTKEEFEKLTEEQKLALMPF